MSFIEIITTMSSPKVFNSLPNDKIVDWSNLKASTDNKIYVTEDLKFVWEG